MNFINILSGLLTPIIAIIAVYIAYQQFRSNRSQGELKIKLDTDKNSLEHKRLDLEEYRLRLDLYNKRYRIFEEIKKVLFKINQDAQIELVELREFKASVNESKFLFDNDISEFLEDLKRNAIEYTHLKNEIDKKYIPTGSPEWQEKTKTESSLRSWFTYEYENVENKFDEYLNFKDLKRTH